jgi:two-component system sensor histidine kinase MtrB
VTLEAFRKNYDRLGPGMQEAFLQLCEDTQRLRRLIDASTRYLKASAGERRIAFERKEVPSLNGLVFAAVESHGEKVSFHGLTGDCAVRTDPYWLGICVTNLVDNALRHGALPVTVRLASRGRSFTVEVSDGGKLRLDRKGKILPIEAEVAGKGLGLGLEITRQILKGLGGELVIAADPTRFTMKVRG